MSRRMIENSERGITLNKGLAWTLLVGLSTASYWFGTELSKMNAALETIEDRQTEDRGQIIENTREISALRQVNARVDQRLLNIEATTQRTETSVQALVEYIRGGTP